MDNLNNALLINSSKPSPDPTCQDLGDFKKLVVSFLNVDAINNKKRQVKQSFMRLPVPGFRPGKAPENIILQHYKAQYMDALAKSLAEEAYFNAVEKLALDPLGAPVIKSINISPLESEFSCSFEVLDSPKFDLPDFSTFKLVKAAEPDLSTQVEEQLQRMRLAKHTLRPFDDTDVSQNNDIMVLNVQLFDGDQKIESMSEDGATYQVEGSDNPDDFGFHLLGLKPQDKKEFSFKGVGFFEGKEMNAKISVVGANKMVPHDLNDDLAKAFGCQDIPELRKKIESALVESEQKRTTQKLVHDLKIKISEHFTFEIPQSLVNGEARLISSKMGDFDSLDKTIQNGLLKQAANNVRLSFVIKKAAKEIPELQLSDMEALNFIHNMLKSQMNGSDTLATSKIEELRKTNKLPIMITRIQEEFVLERLVSKTTIVD